MNIFKLLLPLVLLSSCAQIVTPEGGDKDAKPPVLIKSSPNEGSLNIYPKKIVLYFDENIELKNQSENIYITPDLNAKPLIKAHKNRIEISIAKDSLIKNTTYSINFGKSIADINEGNILENYNYTFSTGTFLDTSVISGTSLLIKENKPPEKALVSIKNLANSLKYTTTTDKTGYWQFKNISNGNYELLIFTDINSNKKLDNSESYFKQNISITDSQSFYKNKLITYQSFDTKPLKVNSVKYINDYMLFITFSVPPKKIETVKYSLIQDFNKKENPLSPTQKSDSFILYHPFYERDSINLNIQTDTLQKFTIIQPKKRKKEPLSFAPELPIIRNNDPVYIKSNIPIKLINSEKIRVNGSNQNFEVKLITPYKLSLIHKLQTNKEIILEKGAITDINGDDNKGDTLLVKIAEEELTGNYEFILKDTISNYKGTIIVKISNETNEYVLKTSLNKQNKLKGLLPGNYTIEAWEDENNNEIWDEGNYFLKQYPERIVLLKNFALIKPNWDTAGVEIYID